MNKLSIIYQSYPKSRKLDTFEQSTQCHSSWLAQNFLCLPIWVSLYACRSTGMTQHVVTTIRACPDTATCHPREENHAPHRVFVCHPPGLPWVRQSPSPFPSACWVLGSLKRLPLVFASRKASNQGLLYHRTCKPDFLCSWPLLNSYLKLREFFNTVPVSWIQHSLRNFPLF